MKRRGFALIGALIAVLLLGALIVGALVATTEETRTSGNVRLSERALYAAESAIEEAVPAWAAAQADSIGISQSVSRASGSGDFTVTTTLLRLDSAVYWLVAESAQWGLAETVRPAVRRRVGVLFYRVFDSVGTAVLFRVGERPWSELF